MREGSTTSLSLDKMAWLFRDGVTVKDRKYNLKTYRQCFVGEQAVDFLVGASFADSRVEAIELGRSFAREFNLFEHVSGDHEFKDQNLLYRFINTGEIRPLSDITFENPELLEMAKRFEAGIEVGDKNHRRRVYHNCFVGKDAVDWLVQNSMAETRSEAVQVGRALAQHFHLFTHVTDSFLFSDKQFFYRFNKKIDCSGG